MSRLLDLEAIIHTNRGSFYHIGTALKQLRDDRLYRELLFDTFEAYLKKRWDMSRSHAYRLIEASRVIDNLSPIGDTLPENEAQLRPLVQLEPFDQRRIWRAFLLSGSELTASNVRRFVLKAAGGGSKSDNDRTEIISAGYIQAVMAMLNQIRLAEQDGWRSTSRQAALFWLRVMKDKILLKV
jgi:hypothetical protein